MTSQINTTLDPSNKPPQNSGRSQYLHNDEQCIIPLDKDLENLSEDCNYKQRQMRNDIYI